MNLKSRLLFILLTGLVATAAFAVFSAGDFYHLFKPTPASGGADAASASFRMSALSGQAAIGRTESVHYSLDHGYYSQSAAALSPVPNDDKAVPAIFRLGAIYPNPSNPMTTIEYDIPKACRATVKVFDIQGRLVRILVDENRDPGHHRVLWNGRNQGGSRAASGLYLVKMDAGDFSETRKITLLK